MRAMVSALLLLGLVGCGGDQGRQMNTTIQRGSMPEGGNFAGIWYTNWGEMSISTQGRSVVGEFCQEDRNRYGRIEGTIGGDVLTFHWITYDVSMAGTRRETEGSAIVQFSFQNPEEQANARFEGTWGYENNNDGGGPLTGDRSPRRSDRFLRGDYSVDCPLREQAEGAPPLSDGEVQEDTGDTGGEFEEEEEEDYGEDDGTSVLDL